MLGVASEIALVFSTFPSDFAEHPQVFPGLLRTDQGSFLVHQLFAIAMELLLVHTPGIVSRTVAGSAVFVALILSGCASSKCERDEATSTDRRHGFEYRLVGFCHFVILLLIAHFAGLIFNPVQ